MRLTREQILEKLRERYAQEPETKLREIAYNLTLASTVEANWVERADRAVKRLQGHNLHAQTPLGLEANKNAQAQLSSCPICKFPMRTVKLLEDKDAFFCPDHRVCVPFPKPDESESDV